MNEEDMWLPEIKERKVKLEEGKKNKKQGGIRIVVAGRGEWKVQIKTDSIGFWAL